MQPICALAAWLYGKGCPIPGFVPARLHMDRIKVFVGASRYVLTPARPRLASAYLYRLLHRLRATMCGSLLGVALWPSTEQPSPLSAWPNTAKCPRWTLQSPPTEHGQCARMYCPGNRLANRRPSLSAYTSRTTVLCLVYARLCA